MASKPEPNNLIVARAMFFLLLALLFFSGCQSKSVRELSLQDRDVIVQEIKQRLEEYRDAVMRRDLEEYLGFWSDSDEFVFAGDGRILGGYEEWAKLTTQHNAETEKWLKWDYGDMHIVVLGQNAATCTTEIEMGKLNVDGSTQNLKVVWTYVFKRHGDVWRVIQTNGTHIEL